MQGSSLPDRNFNKRMYEADTNPTNIVDSFHFKTIGKAPYLLSRMDNRAPTDSKGETRLLDEQQSMDISQTDPSEALVPSAKSLLERLGLHVDTMPLYAPYTDARIDVHGQQNPENNFLPVDNSGAINVSATQTEAQTLENTRFQPEFNAVTSTSPEGTIVTPVLNDFTRSPTLVSNSKDDLDTYARKESSSSGLAATHDIPERLNVPDHLMDANVSDNMKPPVVSALLAHNNVDPSDTLSFAPQIMAPIVTSVLIQRHPSPDPFKRMFASVFDEATAAWEEEARTRETLESPQSFQIERPAVQGISATNALYEHQTTLGPSKPTTITSSSQSLSEQKSSKPIPQNTLTTLERSQITLGRTTAPLTHIPVETVSPSHENRIASPRACTGASKASLPNNLIAGDTTCSRQILDSREQREELEYVNDVSHAGYQSSTEFVPVVEGRPAAIQARNDGNVTGVRTNNAPTRPSVHATAQSTEATLAEKPTPGMRSNSKTISGGLMLGTRQLQSSSNKIPPVQSPPPIILREGEALSAPSVHAAPPVPTATTGDACKAQVQSKKALGSIRLQQDLNIHPMKGSMLPPVSTDSGCSKKDSAVSRPLKRRLSSSIIVKKEEDSAGYTLVASEASQSFLRPIKIKKLEIEDERRLLKVEPKEDESLVDFDGHASTSHRQDFSPSIPTETQCSPCVEVRYEQRTARTVSPSLSFRYPSEPPQTATSHPITPTMTEAIRPMHGPVDSVTSGIDLSGKGNAANKVGRAPESDQSLLLILPAPSTSFHSDSEARVWRERPIPTREFVNSSKSEVRPDRGRNVSRTRYLRDVGRSPPRRACSPTHRTDHYSPVPAPRYAPNDRYERRRSMSPGRSLSPRRYDSRYIGVRHSEYEPARSPPPYNWDRNPTVPQERFADLTTLAHHSFSARAPESQPNVTYRDLEDRRYRYEASTDFFDSTNGPGPENSRQRGRSPHAFDIDRNGEPRRYGNSAATSPSTSAGQGATHPPQQRALRDRVSAPAQVSSSILPRVEGSAQSSNANVSQHGPKRKTSHTHNLPPKPGFHSSSDEVSFGKTHITPVLAMQLSDRIEPLSRTRTRTIEKRTSVEDQRLPVHLNQVRYRPTEYQGAISDAYTDTRASHSHANDSTSLLPRIDAPLTAARNKGLPSNSRTVLNIETEPRAKARHTVSRSKTQNGPLSPGGSERRNVSRPIPRPDKSDLKRRISNSQSPSCSPITREFNAPEQQGNLLNRLSQLESEPSRNSHGNQNSFSPSPRTRQNRQHPFNNNTAPQPIYRAPEPPSPSPGEKLARRIK